MNFFRKKHKYETQSDLQDLSVEEIIRIDPKDVGFYIVDETGGNPLTGYKLKALNRLLSFKKNILPPGTPVPEKMIQQFLNEDAEIRKVTDDARNELVKENKEQTINDLKMLGMQRGIDSLNNQPPAPVTEKEVTDRRWTKIGGRTRKRRKTRKQRKSLRKSKKSLRKTRKPRKRQK